jgi:dihydrofolate reductase
MLAAGLVDEVAMDVAPVVLGSGKRYFGSVDAQHLLEDAHVVIRGDRGLHLRYRVRRQAAAPQRAFHAPPTEQVVSGRASLKL